MSLNNVTLTGKIVGATPSSSVVFTPSSWISDPGDQQILPPAQVTAVVSAQGSFSVSLLATDNAVTPSGWYWTVNISGVPGEAFKSWSFFLPFANGATQDLSSLVAILPPSQLAAYMPLPSGPVASGQVPIATGVGEGSTWGNVATNPMTQLGDLTYGASGGALTRLPGDTSNARKFLREQSSGGVAAAPVWDTLQVSDIPGQGAANGIASLGAAATVPAVQLPVASTSVQGAVVLDGTGTDIQAPGNQAPGSTGKATDAGHVHPLNEPLAGDYGYLSWAFDPVTIPAGQALASGTIYVTRIRVSAPITVTNIIAYLSGSGSGLTAGQSFAGIYNAAGTLIAATADQSSNWTTTGTKTMPLVSGPFALSAGFYFVAFVSNGTTPPNVGRSNSSSVGIVNGTNSAASSRCATNSSGTSLPGTLTLSSNVAVAYHLWAALT